MTARPTLDGASQDAIDKMEAFIDGLEDRIEDLQEENAILRRQLAISSPRNVRVLRESLTDYLDWMDSPNETLSSKGISMINTQLRDAVNNALRELQ